LNFFLDLIIFSAKVLSTKPSDFLKGGEVMRGSIAIIITIALITAPVSAVSMLDYSTNIVKSFRDISKTEDLSLIVMALSLALNRTENLNEDDVWKFTNELINWQNEDGGWGYFFGSISSVPDTSFALIALSKARGR